MRGSPERDMLFLGAGGRGEGLDRPEFVMNCRRRRERILAISSSKGAFLREWGHGSILRDFECIRKLESRPLLATLEMLQNEKTYKFSIPKVFFFHKYFRHEKLSGAGLW